VILLIGCKIHTVRITSQQVEADPAKVADIISRFCKTRPIVTAWN
jgi:hypothetical protein